MSAQAKASAEKCQVCDSTLDSSLNDLGCPVCLFQTGLRDPPETEQEIAQQFGSYLIAQRSDGIPDELGRGSMGITFRATDATLNRPVALKIIDPRQHGSDRARERFMREARVAAGLRHPNIATIHHFGIHEGTGQYFYAMELVEGETLEERVRRTGPIDSQTVLGIAEQVVAALTAAEQRGLIHRDLKPGNIMLASKEGGVPEVKVIDFGLAKAVTDEGDLMAMTRDGFVGSPAFASPEQFAKARVDVRSDVFSLGVTLWFALTGKMPFPGHSIEEIQAAQLTGRLPIQQLKAAGVPSRLIALITSILAIEPAARPSLAELAIRLQRVAASRTTSRVLLAAATLLSILAVIFFVSRKPNEHPHAATSNPAAREAFLKGRFFWNKRKSPDFQIAQGYFERAIALDPGYAEAYAGLADTYHFLANNNRIIRDEYYAKAKEMNRRALQLNPNLAEAHASLGLLAMNYDWDWPASEREFKRALALDPDSTVAHQWYATYLTSQGRFDEAIAQIERARQLDPLSIIINTDAGQILYFARRYKEAEEKLAETVRLDPRFGLARIWLGCVYVEQKRYEEAMTEFKIYHEIVGEPSGWGDMGYIYGITGKRKEAEEMLSLVEKKMDETMDHVLQLWIYTGLGRIDDAFACLEIDYRSHATSMTSLKVNPIYDRLRSDPRFTDLMRRVHLAP